MFEELEAHGGEATISWAWHTAAVCRTWRIHKSKKSGWSLVATVTRVDPFKLQQRPLLPANDPNLEEALEHGRSH